MKKKPPKMPKLRVYLSAIHRKAGAFSDRKKENNKMECRKLVVGENS
jgi:hypothetical protein